MCIHRVVSTALKTEMAGYRENRLVRIVEKHVFPQMEEPVLSGHVSNRLDSGVSTNSNGG